MTCRPLVLLFLWLLLLSGQAKAQPAPPGSGELEPERPSWVERHLELHGYLRVRMDLLENFDLNHGPTPSTGQPLFPIPASDPRGSTLLGGNMRLRLDPTVRLGWGVSLHARIDILDNLVLGSTPDGLPATAWVPISGGAVTMRPPQGELELEQDSIVVKRAWGEVLLPFGLLSAGRMGALVSWGTGFFINSGSCLDCDLGDSGDRIAFSTPLLGHLVTLAYDFGASGPTSAASRSDPQPFNLDSGDDVQSAALIVARYDTPEVIDRYVRAGRTVLQYGVLASVRTQEFDLPNYYLTADPAYGLGAEALVRRELLAFAADLWFGLRRGPWRLDLEGALVLSQTEDASLQPGVELLQRVTSRLLGGVARVSRASPRLELELELGAASGDSAPGFGVRSPLGQTSSQPGDLDGPQLRIPGDTRVNNFRFNTDYHVDLILWRRIVGTVTDAFYVRPTCRYRPWRGLELEANLISSLALEPSSSPGGERPLGVELDLWARYTLEPGFEAWLAYGVLFPLAGLDNAGLSLDAEPAQTLHLLLAFRL